MQADRVNLRTVLERLDARDVARLYGNVLGEPKRRIRPDDPAGRDVYFAPGGERTASFTVYSGGFKNYGATGEKGSKIGLIQLLEGCSKDEAIRRLIEIDSGHVLPARHVKTVLNNSKNSAVSEPPNARAQYAARQVIEAGKAALWSARPRGPTRLCQR